MPRGALRPPSRDTSRARARDILVVIFDVTESDVFADQSLDITNVMIAFQGEPKKLIYFQDHELMLKNPVGTGSNQIASARFPFLGVLNINSRNDNIDEMTGLWYDIDNSILNLARMPALKFAGEGWGCFRKTHWSRG
jgi:hypothetical protein